MKSGILEASCFTSLTPSISTVVLKSLSFKNCRTFARKAGFLRCSSSSSPSNRACTSSVANRSINSCGMLKLAIYHHPLSILHTFKSLCVFPNIMIALGKGALFLLSPNFKRPLMKRISEAFMAYSCHHFVSVREGTRQTTSASASIAFFIQAPIFFPYGGFIQQTPCQSLDNPSSRGEKNLEHFAFSAVAHTSISK